MPLMQQAALPVNPHSPCCLGWPGRERKRARLEGVSGPVATEQTIDVLVVQRYKKRGMTWWLPALSALLKLVKARGAWEATGA